MLTTASGSPKAAFWGRLSTTLKVSTPSLGSPLLIVTGIVLKRGPPALKVRVPLVD